MKERTIEIQADEKLIVTVAQAHETQPTQTTSLASKGKLKYKVGLLSDMHFDVDDSHNSEYANDFSNAIYYFRNSNVSFICNAGDICQYNDDDLKLYNELYTNYAWAPTGANLRIFTSLGNHDYMRLFSNGQDLGKLNNYIAPFTGEDYWKQYGYAQKTDYIQFFEYNGQWNKQLYGKGRTVKSKLSYWVELNGDIYIFLSIDYGEHRNPNVWDWCARAMNLLDYNDTYVRQMTDYVKDTPYNRDMEKNYDYQFYHPNALMWVKDIIENNKGRRIFLFMHHFLPANAGDTFDTYKHLRMWPVPTSAAIENKYYSGSNTVCGITYWFFDKLLKENTNVVCFGGHSHCGWTEQEDKITRRYNVTQPTGSEVTPVVDDLNSLNGTEYDYQIYRTVGSSVCDCAPTIHLPSLSKPTDRYGTTRYGASEGGLMEVYENGIVIKCIRFKEDGSPLYTNEVVKTIEL